MCLFSLIGMTYDVFLLNLGRNIDARILELPILGKGKTGENFI
jgi:hypothetical protein